tara:strand:- start:25 stop:327 length:303 start_codon:yes stop_codon:yes gene_type:complete
VWKLKTVVLDVKNGLQSGNLIPFLFPDSLFFAGGARGVIPFLPLSPPSIYNVGRGLFPLPTFLLIEKPGYLFRVGPPVDNLWITNVTEITPSGFDFDLFF